MSLAVWEDAWGRVPELPEIDAGLPPEGCATNARVGAYDAREFLGKGEFAKVHACVARRDAAAAPPPAAPAAGAPLALKTISTEQRVHRSDAQRTLRRNRRVGTEIKAMRRQLEVEGRDVSGVGVGGGGKPKRKLSK